MCSQEAIEAHQRRLRNTIDVCFALEAYIPGVNSLASMRPDESSGVVRERVTVARLIQYQRTGATRLNNTLSREEMEEYSPLDAPNQKLFESARWQLSLTSEQERFLWHVARTIADLASRDTALPGVSARHMAEAILYRPRWRTK